MTKPTLIALALAASIAPLAHAQLTCGAAGADAGVRDIAGSTNWGSGAFSVGFTLVNVGTSPIAVQPSTPNHPGEATNLYRLQDGVLEQVGMSWVYHEFSPLETGSLCTCSAAGGGNLGAGCQTPTGASFAGTQSRLGPRSQANPTTGVVGTASPGSGFGATDRRLTVADGVLNTEASWLFEVMALSQSEAGSASRLNNVSHRPCVWSGSAFSHAGATVLGQPAILALGAHGYTIALIDVPGDGRFILASRAIDLDGTWQYEYALYNLSSDRSAASFEVPIPTGSEPGDSGFHDVDYFGEPYDSADWGIDVASNALRWSTTPFEVNPNANALRWGTLYNFRVQYNSPPTLARTTIGLFKPGADASVTAAAIVPGSPCPADLDGDGLVGASDLAALLGSWGSPGGTADLNGDGAVNASDLAGLLGGWGPCA